MPNLVSNEYYTNTWLGTAASSSNELTKMLSRAEDIVTMTATRSIVTNPVSPWVQKAICSQAEYLINGAYNIMIGTEQPVDSASLGEYSYSNKDTGNNTFMSNVICALSVAYLKSGGFISAVLG